jgi:hypothetical protein
MPADFGDITTYHHEEAARHYALAQAAREQGCLAEAEFQAGLAARWDEAAREQKIGMRQTPDQSKATQKPDCPPPPPMPRTIICLMAVMRGVKCIAATLRQFVFRRSAPINGLSLH